MTKTPDLNYHRLLLIFQNQMYEESTHKTQFT